MRAGRDEDDEPVGGRVRLPGAATDELVLEQSEVDACGIEPQADAAERAADGHRTSLSAAASAVGAHALLRTGRRHHPCGMRRAPGPASIVER
jgi:hypothetical protein